MIEREIEAKFMLTSASFLKLKTTFFASSSCQTQTNHYFDTPDGFISHQHHAMLRVREKGDHCVLTLKAPNPNGEGLLEYHQDSFQWDHTTGTLLIGPGTVATQLSLWHTPFDALHHRTSLLTHRYEVKEDDVVICLDENHYGGTIDYEIECEHHSMKEAQQRLALLFGDLPDAPRMSILNKVQRAFATLLQLK